MLQNNLWDEFAACAGEADITFVLDSSGSIGIQGWNMLTNFVATVVENLYIGRDGVRVAIVKFTEIPIMVFSLDTYFTSDDLIEAINTIEYDEGAGTNTAGALRMVRNDIYGTGRGDRLFVRDIVIVVTDGFATVEPNATIPAAEALHDRGIRTFAIGIGNQNNPRFQDTLNGIASNPDSDHTFGVSSLNTLTKIEDTLIRRTCREAPPSKLEYVYLHTLYIMIFSFTIFKYK